MRQIQRGSRNNSAPIGAPRPDEAGLALARALPPRHVELAWFAHNRADALASAGLRDDALCELAPARPVAAELPAEHPFRLTIEGVAAACG